VVNIGVVFTGRAVAAFLIHRESPWALLLIRHDPLWVGAANIGFGVAIVGAGVALLVRSGLLFGIAYAGVVVANIGAGVAELGYGNLLGGVADIGVVVAMSSAGVTLALLTPGGTRLKRWLPSLIQEPVPRPTEDPAGENPGRRSYEELPDTPQQTDGDRQPEQAKQAEARVTDRT
jgi:hypothetical protein